MKSTHGEIRFSGVRVRPYSSELVRHRIEDEVHVIAESRRAGLPVRFIVELVREDYRDYSCWLSIKANGRDWTAQGRGRSIHAAVEDAIQVLNAKSVPELDSGSLVLGA